MTEDEIATLLSHIDALFRERDAAPILAPHAGWDALASIASAADVERVA